MSIVCNILPNIKLLEYSVFINLHITNVVMNNIDYLMIFLDMGINSMNYKMCAVKTILGNLIVI